MTVKNFYFIIKEYIDGHLLFNTRLKQIRKARLYPALISKPPPICRERERERERTVEEEEESSRPCVECEVPREFLLHRSEPIPPPVL